MKGTMGFHIFKSQKGSSSFIIICITIIVILASALATDIGIAAVERYKLASSAEMTARTGMELLSREEGLSKRRQEIVRRTEAYAVARVGDLTKLDIKVSDNGKELSVYMERPFEFIFLQVAGYKGKPIKARITARLSGINAYKGIKPFAVENQKFEFGKQVMLSDSTVDNREEIRYVPLNLGNGNFGSGIVYGYRRLLKTGDGVYGLTRVPGEETKEGLRKLLGKCSHRPQCTYDKYAKDCPRILILPVVDKTDATGDSTMEVAGFAGFFAEGTAARDGHVLIQGRFIRHVVNARTSDAAADFGLAGIKVIR